MMDGVNGVRGQTFQEALLCGEIAKWTFAAEPTVGAESAPT